MSDNNSSYTPLQLAVKQGNYKKTEEFLNEHGLKIDDEWIDYDILIDAVKSGDPKLVQLLINHGCRVNKPRANVSTPLHIAVERNYVDIVEILLKNGADPSAKYDKYTLLHYTINTRSVEVVKLLLDYKANVCAKDSQEGTPIHRAHEYDNPFRGEMLDLMLKAHNGKMPNLIDHRGLSIFHVACTRNLPDVVENFLKKKIDVNSRVRGSTYTGFTGMHFAAMYYQVDVIRVLLKYGANVNAICERGLSPLWMATKYIFFDDIAHKLNNKISTEFQPLTLFCSDNKEMMEFLAKELRNTETVQLLLENKSNVSLINKKGTPLIRETIAPRITMNFSYEVENRPMIASVCSFYANKCRAKAMKMLLSHGVDVNTYFKLTEIPTPNPERGSLLHLLANNTANITANFGWKKVTKTLLKNGADPNAKSSAGFTPLHKAAKIGFFKFIIVLLEYKANPNITDRNLCTPLHYARHEKTIKALIDGGADVNAKDKNGRPPALKVEEKERAKSPLKIGIATY